MSLRNPVQLAAALLLLAPVPAWATLVVCEPQGGANPNHPNVYWYDVTPDPGESIVDFHVQVGDGEPKNYVAGSFVLPQGWTFGPAPHRHEGRLEI
ncbi:MAG: hypothetical protein ACE5G2_02340 [Candidatus Krumholzibacteriia bacterium]